MAFHGIDYGRLWLVMRIVKSWWKDRYTVLLWHCSLTSCWDLEGQIAAWFRFGMVKHAYDVVEYFSVAIIQVLDNYPCNLSQRKFADKSYCEKLNFPICQTYLRFLRCMISSSDWMLSQVLRVTLGRVYSYPNLTFDLPNILARCQSGIVPLNHPIKINILWF